MATIQIPLPLYVPDANGNGYPILYAATNHRHQVPAFLKDVDGYWYGHVRVPQDYVSTPKIILSIGANATSGVTTLGVATKGVANTASYNVTYTTETNQDITVAATAYLRKDVTFSLTSSPAAGDDLVTRIGHIGTAVNDTLAVDTILFSTIFQYATV